tara:strand:+ start:260 stop:820 length:561 start_codon:yes stop_codon:yes gene_type:complete
MERKSQKGFTLVEMIIVIVVIGIIGSMAATMLFQGAKTFVGETDRQGFVNESRSAFWRIMRDTQGQASPIDFASSSQNILYLKNGKNEQKDFQIGSTGYLNLRLGNGGYNSLSNQVDYSNSVGFKFYDYDHNEISPSQSGLSNDQANNINLSKLDLRFIKDDDTLFLSSYVYPHNFRFGKKMSYHE